MTRLRSLIKEVLTVQPKKDCNCGCGGCAKKSPVITENRIKKAISEGLTYHVENKIPLHESVYRIGSKKHFELINEARKLWVRELIDVSEDDQAILETHLGNFGMYEGESVPLDMPMVHEDEAAFEYNKARAGRIMKDLFGPDFEFDYTYKLEGDRIIIHPEGYNPDGTLFDMKDVHKEKIIRTFQDKMPKAQATPNNGGGITVNLKESLNEVHKLLRNNDKYLGYSASEQIYYVIDSKTGKEVKHTENAMAQLYGSDWKEQIDEAKKKKKKEKKDPPLNKPKRGGSKAYYVYVRDPKTKKIKKVSFGSGGLRAKIKNKEARKRFASRHNCDKKKDRTTAGYWSCNLPRYAEQLGLGSNMSTFW